MTRVASQHQKKNSRKPIAKRAIPSKPRAANARRGVACKGIAARRANQQRRQQPAKPAKRKAIPWVCSECASFERSLINMLPQFVKLVDKLENKKVVLVSTRKDKSKPRLLRKTITGPLCDMPVRRKRAVSSRKLSKPGLKAKPKLAAKSKKRCGANKTITRTRQSTKMKTKPLPTIEMALDPVDEAINDAGCPQQYEVGHMDN